MSNRRSTQRGKKSTPRKRAKGSFGFVAAALAGSALAVMLAAAFWGGMWFGNGGALQPKSSPAAQSTPGQAASGQTNPAPTAAGSPPATAAKAVPPSPTSLAAVAATATRPAPTSTVRPTAAPTRAGTTTPTATRTTATPTAVHGTASPMHGTATPVPTRKPLPSTGEVVRISTIKPVVALTFDAGADSGTTVQTLDILKKHDIRATFFVTGEFADRYPAIVKRMAADGHEVGNHSYSHSDLTKLSDEAIAQELERADQAIKKLTGSTTKPLMRTPFGSRNEKVLHALSAAGYISVYWDLDGEDWKEGATVDGVTTRVLTGLAPGSVAVMHCSTAATTGALPAILDGFAQRGTYVVTVSSLLSDN